MNINQTLQKIPTTYASATEELFMRYKKGEITERDYQIHNAEWVADNLSRFLLRPYPAIPEAARSYVRDRLANTAEFTPRSGIILGEWAAAVSRISVENSGDVDLFLWCKSICEDAGLRSQVEKLESAIRKFQSDQFPMTFFKQALEVKRRDAIEKQKGGA